MVKRAALSDRYTSPLEESDAMEFDSFDRKILATLQEDARISMVDLSNKIGLSETPCGRRVKRLEGEGVIERYVALLNAEALGLGLNVFINVRLERQTLETVTAFENAIKLLPEVTECYLVTGEYDYLLHIRVSDVSSLKDFVRDRLTNISGIKETHSSVALQSVKQTAALPIPRADRKKPARGANPT
jgi:Lrp/AsnC family leucine-responsive transcriptional regulator